MGEQPVRCGRDDFPGRVSAVARPTPARTQDPPLVGLYIDLDDRGGTLAISHIRLAAAATHARLGWWRVHFEPFLQRRPRLAPMAAHPGLLAAAARRTRLVLLFTSAPVQRSQTRTVSGAVSPNSLAAAAALRDFDSTARLAPISANAVSSAAVCFCDTRNALRNRALALDSVLGVPWGRRDRRSALRS